MSFSKLPSRHLFDEYVLFYEMSRYEGFPSFYKQMLLSDSERCDGGDAAAIASSKMPQKLLRSGSTR